MEYYFAYGSNLSKKQMYDRECKILGSPIRARLYGYRLGFTKNSIRRKGGVADIIKADPNQSVKGVVYPLKTIEPLDGPEGCNWGNIRKSVYYRKKMKVQTDQEEIEVWVYYVVNKDNDFIQPSKEYVTLIIKGSGPDDGGLYGFGFSKDEIIEVCIASKIAYEDFQNP